MNRFLISFFSIMLMGIFAFAQETTTIKGKITNPNGKDISVRYVSNPITGERQSHKADLNEAGEFELSFEIGSPTAASVSYGSEVSQLYLHPGDDLTLTLDPNEFDETIAYEGKGAPYNNFMAAYFLKFSDAPFFEERKGKMKDLNGVDFKAYGQEVMERKTTLLNEWKEKHNLSEDFAKYMETDFLYSMANDLLQYPSYHNYLNKADSANIKKLDGDYYGFLADIPLQNEEAMSVATYRSFLSGFINHKYSKLYEGVKDADHSSWTKTQMQLSKILFDGKVEQYMVADMLNSSLQFGDPTAVAEEYEAFIEAHPEHKPILQPKFEKVLSLAAGNPAPDFTLVDLEGNKVSLSDFKGKVVYLDFWASWCGPCIAEIPSARKLKKHYADNKDVVFMYVSVDTDEEPWRKIIEKRELTGLHLYAAGWDVASEKYNVAGIPSYFLINRDGSIAVYQAPRPSSGEKLISLIDEALDKGTEVGSEEE